jgi:diguanylate cyclase (GGDEF)-like protein
LILALMLAMSHYIGLAALKIETTMTWNWVWFALATGGCTFFLVLSLIPAPSDTSKFFKPITPMLSMSAGLFTLQIIGHLAIDYYVPYGTIDPSLNRADPSISMMAIGLVAAGIFLIVSGLAVHLIDTALREESDAQLRHMALQDQLTGLPNRIAFKERLASALNAPVKTGFVAVIGIDLNRFKDINDTWGHDAGDLVLGEVSRRLNQFKKNGALPARFGGDEFAIISRFRSEESLQAFASAIQAALIEPITLEIGKVGVGASLGVAIHPRDGKTSDELIRNADLVMYKAKREIVDSICFYDEKLGDEFRLQRMMITDLKSAIANDQLSLHYQPQIDVETYEIVGYETLLRWNHPTLGTISPSVFIPLAEANGLIIPLGEWVLSRACAHAAQWSDPVKVAVNISAVQLSNDSLGNRVHELLLDTGLSANRLEIELTETALLKDQTQGLRLMRQIKNLGVSIALDDFGAGHSSLVILRSFPFDRVKLDMSFVQGMTRDGRTKAVAESVIMLAKNLSIDILAEGVETEHQMQTVHDLGFDHAQGFLMGKPAIINPKTMEQPGNDRETQWRVNFKTA